MKEKSRRKTDFYPDYWYRCQQRWELPQCFLLPSFLLVWWKYPKQEDVVLEADQEALEVCGSKSKIKYTPFKATSARSPVIVSQTKLGSRSSAFNKFVFAHAVHRYEFSSAPVCRQGYQMYRSYVSIPVERERLLDDKGNLCLDTSAGSQTMKEGIKDNLVDLGTTMEYRNGETKTLYGLTTQCPLKTSEDTKDQGFEVASLARYNTSIVTGTTCKEV